MLTVRLRDSSMRMEEISDVWIYDFKRGTSSRLTFDPNGDGTPIWSPDGTKIVFGSNRQQTGGYRSL